MKVQDLIRILNADFYTGVPDSQLRALCDYLVKTYGTDPKHHVIAANEGNAVGLAAGYHLATGKIPVVYMQNSGEGNAINPIASLVSRDVYAIPMVFIVGWRGEPGVHDEPQHVYQGKVTLRLLEDMDIPHFVIGKDTTEDELEAEMDRFRAVLAENRPVAFVIRKGALTLDEKVTYKNSYTLTREEAIRQILSFTGEDPIVSTTGKASRELFELREAAGEGHSRDFLTVGSMGHSSSIALGLALQSGKRVWCLDGDGAAIMHMGALAVIGSIAPKNLIHIVLNNEAHESVGGMPTAASCVDLTAVARACGYPHTARVETAEQLSAALERAKNAGQLCFIEVRCAVGSRPDLGRPTTTPAENKTAFTQSLRGGALGSH